MYLESWELHFVMELRIQTVGFKQQFPEPTRRLHQVKQGHPPRMRICGEWQYGTFWAVNLPRQPRILEFGAVPTWATADINLNQR